MTKREFYNAIISMNSVSAEMKEKAADLIAALDKEASRPSKKSVENAPVKAAILDLLASHSAMLTSEVAAALKISTAKASSLLLQLANESKVVGEEISVPKQGKRKQWRLAATDEMTE
jgi:hypothetical protein